MVSSQISTVKAKVSKYIIYNMENENTENWKCDFCGKDTKAYVENNLIRGIWITVKDDRDRERKEKAVIESEYLLCADCYKKHILRVRIFAMGYDPDTY